MGNILSYNVKVGVTELTIYAHTEDGRVVDTPHKCQRCDKHVTFSLTLKTIVDEIVDADNQTISLRSRLGVGAKRKIQALLFHDKSLCEDCSDEVALITTDEDEEV